MALKATMNSGENPRFLSIPEKGMIKVKVCMCTGSHTTGIRSSKILRWEAPI